MRMPRKTIAVTALAAAAVLTARRLYDLPLPLHDTDTSPLVDDNMPLDRYSLMTRLEEDDPAYDGQIAFWVQCNTCIEQAEADHADAPPPLVNGVVEEKYGVDLMSIYMLDILRHERKHHA